MPRERASVNVGPKERVASGLVGAALVGLGLRRMGLGGAVLALGGLAMMGRGATGHCGLYTKMGIDRSRRGARPRDYFERGIHLEEHVTIRRPASELFAFWRRFENLPRFMEHVKDVRVLDERRSHWIVEGPAGRSLEWDAEIINEEPDRLISWKTLPGTSVDNAGTVTFRDGPDGTDLHVVMDYLPPAGRLGVALAELVGERPERQIREDLGRLRDIFEGKGARKPVQAPESEEEMRAEAMQAEGGSPSNPD